MVGSKKCPRAPCKARVRHQTAADVASELGLSEALQRRLRALERSVEDSPGKLRCGVCGDEVMKNSQLLKLRA